MTFDLKRPGCLLNKDWLEYTKLQMQKLLEIGKVELVPTYLNCWLSRQERHDDGDDDDDDYDEVYVCLSVCLSRFCLFCWENYFGRWKNYFGRAGGKIILAGWKIILAGGKIILTVRNFFSRTGHHPTIQPMIMMIMQEILLMMTKT